MEVSTVQEEIDLATDSPLGIEKTGLYTPFPVHAYRILGQAKEHIAKDVLLCLVSHLGYGKKNKRVKPSYGTICRETGRGRGSVAKGLRILEEFGFIRKLTIQKSQTRKQNIYYIQESCYQANLMNDKARSYLPLFGRCQCGAAVRQGEYGIGGDGYHHYGCGALVFPLKSRQKDVLVAEKMMDVGNGTYFQYLQSTDAPLRGSEN
jgi:hypothetical protein